MANGHVSQAGDGWMGGTVSIGEVKRDLNLPSSTPLNGTVTITVSLA